jgi:SAM-dependent methyltransferase
MFEKFPKQRKQLPPAYISIYNSHIKSNREGATAATSLSMKMERWLHKQTAADVNKLKNISTLEIGAGTLNQFNFENNTPYDIVEPMSEMYTESKHLAKVRKIYNDIEEVPNDNVYERIISIATFEHITNLPDVVAKTCLLLKEGGSLRVAIPNEGTILWTLGTKLFTGIEFKIKYKLDYGLIMKYEHVNTAKEIEEVLNYFYKTVKCTVFGISKLLAFYRFYECKRPQLEIVRSYRK